jgi:hypothetical protein
VSDWRYDRRFAGREFPLVGGPGDGEAVAYQGTSIIYLPMSADATRYVHDVEAGIYRAEGKWPRETQGGGA